MVFLTRFTVTQEHRVCSEQARQAGWRALRVLCAEAGDGSSSKVKHRFPTVFHKKAGPPIVLLPARSLRLTQIEN